MLLKVTDDNGDIVERSVNDIIENIADVFVAVDRSKDTIENLLTPLRAANLKMGTIKQQCALSLQFKHILECANVKATTARNYLSLVRKALNEGTKFSFNASLDKIRAAAKTTTITKPASAAPSADIEPVPSSPAGTTATTPKRLISMPSDAIDAIVVALSNVRATCTQDTWLHVLTLNPALAQFLDRANGVWKAPAPVVETPAPVVETPAPVAPAKRTRKAK